jgi:Family of unknown function (DUF6494)
MSCLGTTPLCFGRRSGGVGSAGKWAQLRGDAGAERPATLRRCAAESAGRVSRSEGVTMEEEVFNMSVRKFLKTLGVTAQREIERAVREQLERGDLQGDETFDATATVTVAGLSHDVVVTGKISLA